MFVDLLETSKGGKFFLTKFAPQAWGWVQHGAVHPFLTWALLTPLAYILGSIGVSLCFNPAVLALAALYLDRICKYLGFQPFERLVLILAFLFSKHVGLIMMYEVHPEAMYPLLSLGLVFALLQERWRDAVLWGVFLGLIKMDSFLVIWGVFVAALFLRPQLQQKKSKLFVVLLFSGIAYVIQLYAIHFFKHSHTMGVVPEVGPLIGGHSWDSPEAIINTVRAFLDANGGLLGSVIGLLKFITSKGWIEILFPAPWLILSPGFWISELPLVFGFSLRGANAILWNYYSAPFMSCFWLFLIHSLNKKRKSILWPILVLILSLLNGSESIVLKIPKKTIFDLRTEAASYQAGLSQLSKNGVVVARLLPFVPLYKVISDRLPFSTEDKSQVDFYFLTKTYSSYNITLNDLHLQIEQLRQPNSGFHLVKETENLILFVRN